jgi:hypothetical protein
MDLRYELLGIARGARGWSFTPARVALPGPTNVTGPRLEAVLTKERPEILALLPEQGADAIWARARIEALFGIASIPAADRVEKSLMEFGFLARPEQDAAVNEVPFICSDNYGRSAVYFAEATPPQAMERIGDAFWALVADGGQLAGYRDRAFHPGASVWMEYGCANGTLFLEYPDDEASPPPSDPVEEDLAEARRFLERLGPDRPGTVCNEAGCGLPTVRASLCCRRHHYEAVTGRPCPIALS